MKIKLKMKKIKSLTNKGSIPLSNTQDVAGGYRDSCTPMCQSPIDIMTEY